jgi:hypothetical protein
MCLPPCLAVGCMETKCMHGMLLHLLQEALVLHAHEQPLGARAAATMTCAQRRARAPTMLQTSPFAPRRQAPL